MSKRYTLLERRINALEDEVIWVVDLAMSEIVEDIAPSPNLSSGIIITSDGKGIQEAAFDGTILTTPDPLQQAGIQSWRYVTTLGSSIWGARNYTGSPSSNRLIRITELDADLEGISGFNAREDNDITLIIGILLRGFAVAGSPVRVFILLRDVTLSEIYVYDDAGDYVDNFAVVDNCFGLAADDDYLWVLASTGGGQFKVYKYNHSGVQQDVWNVGPTSTTTGVIDIQGSYLYISLDGSTLRIQSSWDGTNFANLTTGGGAGNGVNGDGYVYLGTGSTTLKRLSPFFLPVPETEFFRYPGGSPESLGTPDGGAAIPALDAYVEDGSGNVIRVGNNELIDMRDAVELLAPNYVNVVTGRPFSWSSGDDDNLYTVAVDPEEDDWEKPTSNALDGARITEKELDELNLCIAKLEASALVTG